MIDRLLKFRRHKGQEQVLSTLMSMLVRTSVGDDCWVWLGSKKDGYGQIRIDSKTFMVTRIVAHLSFGFDLSRSDLFICHRCDNPGCINPKHLFVGTAHDNSQDMLAKGRQKQPKPPNHRHLMALKLGEEGKTHAEIASLTGWGLGYVGNILGFMKKNWIAKGQYRPSTNGIFTSQGELQ